MRFLKLIIIIIILATVPMLYRGLDIFSSRPYIPKTVASDEIIIDFFDVGQGDASLIKTSLGQNILVDGGPDKNILKELEKSLDWHDRTIDLMILTHPHDDHVAGLVEVLKRYKTGKILYSGLAHISPAYINWLELVKEKGIPLVIIDKPQKIGLGGDCFIELYYPDKNLAGKTSENINNSSLVFKFVYKELKVLYTGDMESEIERELLDRNIDLSAGIIKIAHHGSDTSSGDDFIKAAGAEYGIISSGKDNKFGHPSLRVIKRLERNNIYVLRTDLKGTVTIRSDGRNIRLDAPVSEL